MQVCPLFMNELEIFHNVSILSSNNQARALLTTINSSCYKYYCKCSYFGR